MLIDIFARSMLTATRQPTDHLRDLPAPAPTPEQKPRTPFWRFTPGTARNAKQAPTQPPEQANCVAC